MDGLVCDENMDCISDNCNNGFCCMNDGLNLMCCDVVGSCFVSFSGLSVCLVGLMNYVSIFSNV